MKRNQHTDLVKTDPSPLQIIAISGSLREKSSNKFILQAVERLAQEEFSDSLNVVYFEGLADLPHFNPDLEDPLPVSVVEFRQLLASTDGLIISSPEYAHGIPGSLKNALDWLVADPAFEGKRVALLNAAVGGAEYAQPQLIEVLKTMSARILFAQAFAGPTVRRGLDGDGHITDPEILAQLRQALTSFINTENL